MIKTITLRRCGCGDSRGNRCRLVMQKVTSGDNAPLSIDRSDEKGRAGASGKDVGSIGCTPALQPDMSDQRSSGGGTYGAKACPSMRPCLPTRRASRIDADRFLFAPIDGALCGRSGDLHSLLLPVLYPIGELLRDAASGKGEQVREHRGNRLW
ncbi:hypothetical protein KDW63_30015 [Burkholderia cenocepacia]|uniref:hypothetical protein n=1 Tax=Burkholderia cenocepacia TaxID=95486 RepID=UPI001B9C289F|nr:hypothetical protein [Burkholderia cenocepacia]MBR8298441.1 hypothetical protein [Burkholderia cenocepacia]